MHKYQTILMCVSLMKNRLLINDGVISVAINIFIKRTKNFNHVS